jgi:hypothetical protein
MVDPHIRIPAPAFQRFGLDHTKIVIVCQMNQYIAHKDIGNKLAHALAWTKAEPPVMVPSIRAITRKEPVWQILFTVLAPVGIADIESIGIDDKVGAGRELVAANHSCGWDALWNREGC